jgi:hypothetical protein
MLEPTTQFKVAQHGAKIGQLLGRRPTADLDERQPDSRLYIAFCHLASHRTHTANLRGVSRSVSFIVENGAVGPVAAGADGVDAADFGEVFA